MGWRILLEGRYGDPAPDPVLGQEPMANAKERRH